MSHRTDRVWLAADEARCEPANVCHRKDTCARYLAPVPQFATMVGVGLPPAWYSGWHCPSYLSAKPQDRQPQPKPVKPAPKGIA